MTGDLLYHLDTANVAKDMELVRQALNQGKLNFMGASYGTQIAAAYAELYPENINRFILDADVDHSVPETSLLANEVSTLEETLDKFFSLVQYNN